MKNDFKKLKVKLFLQIIAVLAITGVIGIMVSKLFVDGILQKPFADGFIAFCINILHIQKDTALVLYHQFFRRNKDILLTAGFILLLLSFFYFASTRFFRYFNQISDNVDKLLDESGQSISLVPELKFMKDKLNTVKETLRCRKEAALESEQRKNDLVVYLAHDIKTPLTSVIGYLNLLSEAPDMPTEQRARYTSISLDKAMRLEELINEFFEITRFNLQQIPLEKREIHLSFMLEQLVDEFYPVFDTKNIHAQVKIDDALRIYGDANQLARVFSNILKNAAAYSYENSMLEIHAAKEDSKDVKIIFRSRGPQIPEHQLHTIFEKFYRLDTARSGNTGGAGLGLAIAKEIVALHHGTITAKSNEECTEFIITLPSKS